MDNLKRIISTVRRASSIRLNRPNLYSGIDRIGCAQIRHASIGNKKSKAITASKTLVSQKKPSIQPKTSIGRNDAEQPSTGTTPPPVASSSAFRVKPLSSTGLRTSASSRPSVRSTQGVEYDSKKGVYWPQDTQSCRLPSGARLSYARLGRSKEAGQVWVLFHGTPGSRLDYTLEHEYAEKHSIRIISIDRPGYGYSSLHDRGMLGFMQDVEHVLDYCGVQEFAVLGVSGGGPYTLAAAYHFPKSRLRKAAIVCGTPHPQFQKSSVSIQGRIYRWFHGWAPWIPGLYREYPFASSLRQSIDAVNGNEKLAQHAYAHHREMTRQKSAGYHNDFKLSQRSWGFNLEDINANPIRWYHGTVDTNTSCEAARATAQLANRYRRNIDYRTVEGLDHGGIQTKKALEVLHWMRE